MERPTSGNPGRPLTYWSEAIAARRRRILKETRAMISEDGVELFSVRKLCKRADVSQRTLYNAFGSKDHVIALAIKEAYNDFIKHTRFMTDSNTLDGALNRLIEVNKRNLKARNYTRAVASIYFSEMANEDIWSTLREMAFSHLGDWLIKIGEDDQFQEWVIPEELANDLANIQFATINDWGQGRIKDVDYNRRSVECFLNLTLGATRGKIAEEAREHLIYIRTSGELPQFPATARIPRSQREASPQS